MVIRFHKYIVDGHRENAARGGHGAHCNDQPLLSEILHHVGEALAFFANQIGRRHLNSMIHTKLRRKNREKINEIIHVLSTTY